MPGPRSLVSDDTPGLRQRVSGLLSRDFDLFGTVDNGRAAVEASSALQPELVLLDISMPVMNGFDAARALARSAHPPLIIFMTVHDDPETNEAARSLGAAGYVLKRDISRELVDAIRVVLDGGRTFPCRQPLTASRIAKTS